MHSEKKPEISLAPHHSNSFGSANSEKNRKSKKEMVLGYILAIDFGRSKVGLAVADMETKIAFAYGILANNRDLLDEIGKIISQEQVGKVIIGVPIYVNENKEEFGGIALGKEIEEKLKIPVEYQNEMFTTKMAQENIKERNGKNISQKDDSEAAKIILQDWLDKA